jgi:2-polyprenyl-3-methyl-5-hydroxy-6-metoxy-1,4-benzoquinol methylase
MVRTYSFNPDSYSMHTQIVNFIGKHGKVLDVGCAIGHISDILTSNGCEVVGIELDKDSARKAENYCREVIIGDVELMELSDEYENYFDFIIFADVLEHLKEPLNVLQRFKKYLKNDGYILVSLPNISNWRLRIKFLFGNFEYEDDGGLLDKTHITFFNENSANKLFKDTGLEIYKFDLTVGDIPKYGRFFHFIGNLWPNLFAYQFLIIAKKHKKSL